MNKVVWRYCCSQVLKTISTAGICGAGTPIVSVFFFETVRPKAPKTSTRIIIISSKPRNDFVRHTARVIGILHPQHRAPHTFLCQVSHVALGGGQGWRGCPRPQWSVAAQREARGEEDVHSWRSPCATSNHSVHVPSSFCTQALLPSWKRRITVII